MSFRCQKCGKAQPDRARPHRVVTQWRELPGNFDHPIIRQIVEEKDYCDECFTEQIETDLCKRFTKSGNV